MSRDFTGEKAKKLREKADRKPSQRQREEDLRVRFFPKSDVYAKKGQNPNAGWVFNSARDVNYDE